MTYFELLQLLQDHVVRHVVEEPIGGCKDDVTQLDVEGRAVCGIRAADTHKHTVNSLHAMIVVV